MPITLKPFSTISPREKIYQAEGLAGYLPAGTTIASVSLTVRDNLKIDPNPQAIVTAGPTVASDGTTVLFTATNEKAGARYEYILMVTPSDGEALEFDAIQVCADPLL